MLMMDEKGMLREMELRTFWCIFLYADNEDQTAIIGHSPLIFGTEGDMDAFLLSNAGQRDQASWKTRQLQLVVKRGKPS